MIVSHKHRFIFLKTRKTAGTSIEIALSALCGEHDIITPIDADDEAVRKAHGGRGPQHYKLSWQAHTPAECVRTALGKPRKQYYNHMPAAEAKALLGDTVWNTYYKFCFERNPWDKVLSQFFALGGYDRFGSVKAYLTGGEVARIWGYDLYSIKRHLAVDKVYKYEEMDESLAHIGITLALDAPPVLPEIKAKGARRSNRQPYQALLNQEEKELVEVIFAREIRLLGYQF